MNSLYGGMSAYIISFKWAHKTGATFTYEKSGFTRFIALVGSVLWWISYIVASFLYTYTVLGWNFINFKLDSVLKIASIVSIVVFLFLIIGAIINKRSAFRSEWWKLLLSMAFDSSITVLFTLIMVYVISLSSSLMSIAVMLGLQIPFFINMVLDLFFSGWLKYGYTGQMSDKDFDNKNTQHTHIQTAFVIILEVLMLVFIIYFGALPYFKSGGMEAIKDKALSVFKGKDTITLLFGSHGIVAAGATVLSAIISTIVKIVKKNR